MNKEVEKKKLNKPVFRLRTGTRSKRRKSIDKWNKWRVPRGIDIKWKRGDGNRPKVGYKTKKELRNLHPKGLPEMILRNKNDILKLSKDDAKNFVFRFAAGIGKKKKEELVKLASEKKLIILNK